MPMVVKNNMAAISTLNTLNKNSGALTKSLGKVSTGMRINGAADDASGYAISERMRVQIRSLDQDNRNAQNGSSMMKVAEGAVNSTIEILKTLKEKVINAANDTNTDSDRATIQKELDQSIDQIDDNANVNYNGKYLLDGSKNNKINATYTHMTNQNLSTDTKASTKLTDLASRAGDALQLQKTDNVTVSYVQQGKTFSTTFQVGDRTLQDIFNEAENIDTTTKTFASADNASVAEANGAAKANSGDAAAVRAAVDALKKTLGKTETDSFTSAQNLKFNVAPTSANVGGGSADFTLVGSDSMSAVNSNTTSATVDGELYTALRTAANDAQTSYNAMVSQGTDLAAALSATRVDAQNTTIKWDSNGGTNAAQLKEKEFQDLINNYASAETKALYNTYMDTVARFEANSQKAQDLLTEYNNKANQLGALELEKDVYDARDSYEKQVNSFLTNLEDAASSNTATSFTYVDSTGLTKTSAALDDHRQEFVKTMVSDLRSQLLNINPGANKAETAATAILNNTKVGTDKVTELATDGSYATLKASADAVIGDNGAKGLDSKTNTLMSDTTATAVLEEAHADSFKQYSGPQLITGSNIGVDGAGKLHSTASGENAISFAAANAGVDGQIAGFTIGVKDAQGNARKSAEASLDAFDESIRGQNASADNAVNLQIGTKANQTITVGLTDMRSQALGLKGSDGSTLNIGNRENANAAINVLDNALAKVLDQATTIGAVQNRLEYTSSNLTTTSENTTASESTIRDADMAKEMTEYTKNNVLLQAAQSMLSQANQNSSAVLSLLQ